MARPPPVTASGLAAAVCVGIEYSVGRCEVWSRSEGIKASIPLNGPWARHCRRRHGEGKGSFAVREQDPGKE